MSSVVIHLIHARPRAKGDKEFSFFTGRSRQCLHTGLSVAHAGAIFMDKIPLPVACDFRRQIVASKNQIARLITKHDKIEISLRLRGIAAGILCFAALGKDTTKPA
jgi:hypothetical protein